MAGAVMIVCFGCVSREVGDHEECLAGEYVCECDCGAGRA